MKAQDSVVRLWLEKGVDDRKLNVAKLSRELPVLGWRLGDVSRCRRVHPKVGNPEVFGEVQAIRCLAIHFVSRNGVRVRDKYLRHHRLYGQGLPELIQRGGG
jgi:hypothetical protein